MTRDYKFVALHQTTYNRLKELGKKGESFDSIITKLLPIPESPQVTQYQCLGCGTFVRVSVNPSGYECPECKKDMWRRVVDDF